MGVIVAVIIAVGASIGMGAHDGVFKKGYDTTTLDTLEFELQAAQTFKQEKKVERLTKKREKYLDAHPEIQRLEND